MEALAITYGLSSAITWGAGDFTGGLASKRSSVLTVIFFSQLIGVALLIASAIFMGEKIPTFEHLIMGGLGGIAGALGLAALYKGLSAGSMGIVAPMSAVIAAVIPIIFSSVYEGLPSTLQLSGFCIAALAVWFLSHQKNDSKIRFNDLYLPFLAGLGFGFFFVFIGNASTDVILWPLVAARSASLSLMFILILFSRKKVEIPHKSQFTFIALAGILDALGNIFFALATQLGRLDISAVLTSLYPVGTVFLAWLILKERLSAKHWIGVVMGVVALVLISV